MLRPAMPSPAPRLQVTARPRLRFARPLAGPALMASVAYMDPGNFATNIQAGAAYGYDLLWVVVAANLIAMLFQALSAKLGIVTGHNLAELSRDHFPRPVVLGMWAASEVAAMATDLAEFLGGALGLSLLTGMPLLAGMAVTGVATYAVLELQRRGVRPLEAVIGIMIGVIGACYLAELVIVPPDWRAAAVHAVVPRLADGTALMLAVGIVGATVMPHALYLHSGLAQQQAAQQQATLAGPVRRRHLIRASNREVLLALGLAGLVNMAMLAMAARTFHDGAHDGIAEIGEAYRTLVPVAGPAAAGLFLAALIASGWSSSAVGTLAGQMIMQGFLRVRVPVWARRLATMLPAFAVVAAGVDATRALVASQVVLSLALPVPMAALLVLARRPAVMGRFALGRGAAAVAGAAAALVMGLNAVLVWQAIAASV